MRIILFSLVLLTLGACMSFSDRGMRPVRDAITAQMPQIELEKEFAISLSGVMFNIIDAVVVSEADISAMDRVQVAVYRITEVPDTSALNSLDLVAALRDKDDSLEWDTIVRVRKEDEQVWVLAGIDLVHERLRAIAVVSLEFDELVLVNVDGKLERLLKFAMDPVSDHRGSLQI